MDGGGGGGVVFGHFLIPTLEDLQRPELDIRMKMRMRTRATSISNFLFNFHIPNRKFPISEIATRVNLTFCSKLVIVLHIV